MAADRLVQAAIEANTKDNVTVVVVHATPTSSKAIAQPASHDNDKQRTNLRPPLWVIVTLITIILLLIAFVLIRLWPSNNATIDLNGALESENVPLVTDERETAVSPSPVPTQPQPTIAPLPSPTALPQVVPTKIPADIPTPPPTFTPSPTPPQLACVLSEGVLFV